MQALGQTPYKFSQRWPTLLRYATNASRGRDSIIREVRSTKRFCHHSLTFRFCPLISLPTPMLQILQMLSVLSFYFNLGKVSWSDFTIPRLVIGLAIASVGQYLNAAIYRAIGVNGVYYGTRLGKNVPWYVCAVCITRVSASLVNSIGCIL